MGGIERGGSLCCSRNAGQSEHHEADISLGPANSEWVDNGLIL